MRVGVGWGGGGWPLLTKRGEERRGEERREYLCPTSATGRIIDRVKNLSYI